MKLLNDIIPFSDWERFTRTGCGDRAEDYLSKQNDAMAEAKQFLQSEGQFAPSATATIKVQKIIAETLFGKNVDIAGKLRQQHLETISESGDEVKRMSPDYIYPALTMRQEIAAKCFAAATTIDEKLFVAIDNHVGFRSIQPFEDLNGRTGAVILESQLSMIVGHPVELSIDGTKYREAIWQALRHYDKRDLDFTISNGLRHCENELEARFVKIPKLPPSPYTKTENTHLSLTPAQIEKLDEADMRALCFNSRIRTINGIEGESPLEDGVYDHVDLIYLGLTEFKRLLTEGFETEQKFSRDCDLNLTKTQDLAQTGVLKCKRQH